MVNFNNLSTDSWIGNRYYDTFKRLLFANSTLVNGFTNWLYDWSVYSNEEPTYEKRYLRVRHNAISGLVNEITNSIDYNDIAYQITDEDSNVVIDDKFTSI